VGLPLFFDRSHGKTQRCVIFGMTLRLRWCNLPGYPDGDGVILSFGLGTHIMNKRVWLGVAAAAVVWSAAPAWSQQSGSSVAAPKGRVVLTVTGNIARTNMGQSYQFDMDMIDALPRRTFTTRTPWYDKPVTFSGPRLADVMAAVGAKGQSIQASAINDYKITIPMSDAIEHGVIMASRIDGQRIPVREKGPLFVVYPFDSSATLRSSVYYERSIWQLKSMHVE